MSMSLNRKSYYEENGMTYEDTSTNEHRQIIEPDTFLSITLKLLSFHL